MTIAVLGPGGVGGYVAAALARAGTDVVVVAREETAEHIAAEGIHLDSVRLGRFTVHPRATARLDEAVDVAVIAVKAPSLGEALDRIAWTPGVVIPLLNGFEHMERVAERFPDAVAGSIRIASERTAPGRIVHTSPATRIELAGAEPFTHALREAEIPARVVDSAADLLWSKLVRLNPLALSTAAADAPIGVVWSHPRRRLLLEGAVDEAAAVAAAEGANVEPGETLEELAKLDPQQTSSLHRDLLARATTNELDAIGGAVARAGARHGIPTPSILELIDEIRARYPHA